MQSFSKHLESHVKDTELKFSVIIFKTCLKDKKSQINMLDLLEIINIFDISKHPKVSALCIRQNKNLYSF